MQYSDDIRDADFKALQKFYEDKWHLEVGNFEGGIDPSSIDQKAGTVDVKYNIYVARVAVVEITGNTRTKDQVIRRELRVKPGMVLNTDAIKNDYERLNSMGFFSKVEPDIKDGPDPKKPQQVTLVWHVTEQRTASASVGFGYSGGLTGQGLYGTLGFSDNNLHGTGNSGSLQLEKGARTGVGTAIAGRFRISATRRSRKNTAPTAASLLTTRRTTIRSTASRASTPEHSVDRRTRRPGIPVTLYADGKRHAARQRRRDQRLELRPVRAAASGAA